jgi:hypothetical protein
MKDEKAKAGLNRAGKCYGGVSGEGNALAEDTKMAWNQKLSFSFHSNAAFICAAW